MTTDRISFTQVLRVNKEQNPFFFEEVERCADELAVVSTLAEETFSAQLKDLEARPRSPATRIFKAARLCKQNNLLTMSAEGKNFYVRKDIFVDAYPKTIGFLEKLHAESNQDIITFNDFSAQVVKNGLQLLEMETCEHIRNDVIWWNEQANLKELYDYLSNQPPSEKKEFDRFLELFGHKKEEGLCESLRGLLKDNKIYRSVMEELHKASPDKYEELFQKLPKNEWALGLVMRLVKLQPHNETLKRHLEAWFLTLEDTWQFNKKGLEHLNRIAIKANLETLKAVTGFLIEGWELFNTLSHCFFRFVRNIQHKHCSMNHFTAFPLLYIPIKKQEKVVEFFKRHGLSTTVNSITYQTDYADAAVEGDISINIPWEEPTQNPVAEYMKRRFIYRYTQDVILSLNRAEKQTFFQGFRKVADPQHFEAPHFHDGFFEAIKSALQAKGIEVGLFYLNGNSKDDGVSLTFSRLNANYLENSEVIFPPQECAEKLLLKKPAGSWLIQPAYAYDDALESVYMLCIKPPHGENLERIPLFVSEIRGKTAQEIIHYVKGLQLSIPLGDPIK